MSKTVRKRSFEELSQERPDLDQVKALPRPPLTIVLDNIRSLHNVGAIFRTADAVRAEKCYLCGITGCPPRSEIRKSSLGAEEAVPWQYAKNPLSVIEMLKLQGYQIVCLEHTTNSVDYRSADYRSPLCLVVGHEFNGVSDEIVRAADMSVEIPMHGVKLSLNVAVAFGIAAFEIINRF